MRQYVRLKEPGMSPSSFQESRHKLQWSMLSESCAIFMSGPSLGPESLGYNRNTHSIFLETLELSALYYESKQSRNPASQGFFD